jgi:hypothetical protein
MQTAAFRLGFVAVVLASGTLWAGNASGHADHGGGGTARPAPLSITQGSFYPMSDEGAAVFGSARLVRSEDSSELAVHVRGLAEETKYPMHLHEGSCGEMGPHYRHDPQGAAEPPNELWPTSDPEDPEAGVTTDSGGVANGKGTAPWTARPEAAAVMIHNHDTGMMVACADLS